MEESRSQFFVRVKDDATAAEAAFGKGTIVDAGIAGEVGFITPLMSEKDFQVAAANVDMISRIHLEA